MHYRHAIRQEIRARLAALPGSAATSLDSLADVTEQSRLPVSVVSFLNEEADAPVEVDEGLWRTVRVLQAAITIVALRTDDLETIAAEVERRMEPEFGPGMIHQLDRTRFQDPKKGEFEYFSLALEYSITYSVATTDATRLWGQGE